VLSVASVDVLTVGVILHIVIRGERMLFVVSVHEAARSSFGFFQACPCDIVELLDYANLIDFKPLIKRDNSSCFKFVLHHHVPVAL
jgi:hypothetical protein